MHSVLRSAETSKFRLAEGDSARCFRKHGVDGFIDNLPVCSLAAFKSEAYGGIGLHAYLRAPTEISEGYPGEYCALFYPGVVDYLNGDLASRGDFKQSTSSISRETEFFDIAN